MPLVLLTGATGHLGATLLGELRRRNVPLSFRLFVRSREKIDQLQKMSDDFAVIDRCEIAVGDLRNEDSLTKALAGVEIIVHAAHSHEYWRGSHYLTEVNVQGVQNLLRAAEKVRSVYRIVEIGSYSAHHLPAQLPPVDVLRRLAPRESSSKAKLSTGHIFADAAARHGYTLDLISPSYMIGPYQLDPTYFGALFHLVLFRPLTWAPPYGINVVDVRDVAHAVLDVLASLSPHHLLATGDNVTYAELFQVMNRAAGYDVTPQPLSPQFLRFIPRLRRFGDFGKHYFDSPHYVDQPGLPSRRYNLASTVVDAIAWAQQLQLFSGTWDVLRWMVKRYL